MPRTTCCWPVLPVDGEYERTRPGDRRRRGADRRNSFLPSGRGFVFLVDLVEKKGNECRTARHLRTRTN